MKYMTHERVDAVEQSAPRLELAASLQAVLHDIPNRNYQLDFQQEEALQAVGEALIEGTDSGYLEMATSSGKTVVASLVAEAAVHAGKRVLMLAPTVAIANQLKGSHSDKVTGLEKFTALNHHASVRMHVSRQKAHSLADVVITTYPGFLNDAKNDHRQLGEFDVVIADECHRSLGTETSNALRSAFPDAFKIGLSATPDFAADRKSEEVYERLLFDFSLSQAIESGKTAPVRALIYETDEVLTLTDQQRDFTERELAPLIHNQERNGTAIALAQAFVEEGRQGLIACIPGASNMHAQMLAAVLERAGIAAADVGSHLSSEEQERRLKAYANGDIKVLTFTRALEEGWDSDKASFAINLAPTTSPVRTKQLLGRILRRKPDGLDSIYIDFLDKKAGTARKDQYTAMHALGLETIDLTRVLGHSKSKNGFRGEVLRGLEKISQKAYERLRRNQGKLLSEVAVKPTVDPLIREWERRLEAEGMPSELPYNSILRPALAKKVLSFCTTFEEVNGMQPTPQEIIEEISIPLSRPDLQTLAKFALQDTYVEGSYDDIPADPDDRLANPAEFVTQEILLPKRLDEVFDTLSEREAGVVAMRFGLTTRTGEPMNLDDIGKEYGVTRERIRQIESKTMSKLRHPSRANHVRDFLDGIRPYATLEKSAAETFMNGHPYDTNDSNHHYHPRTDEEKEVFYAARAKYIKENSKAIEAMKDRRQAKQANVRKAREFQHQLNVVYNSRIKHFIDSIDDFEAAGDTSPEALKSFFEVPFWKGQDYRLQQWNTQSNWYHFMLAIRDRMKVRYANHPALEYAAAPSEYYRGVRVVNLLNSFLDTAEDAQR